jgi:hypothetical protein
LSMFYINLPSDRQVGFIYVQITRGTQLVVQLTLVSN